MKKSLAVLALAFAIPWHAHATASLASVDATLQPGIPLSEDEMSNTTAGSFDLLERLTAAANKGAFNYTITDHDADGGSISFNGINVTGVHGLTRSVIGEATFRGMLASRGFTMPDSLYSGGPVVQLAAPANLDIPESSLLNISIASIKMGNSNASFGSIELKGIDLRGTSLWMWRH